MKRFVFFLVAFVLLFSLVVCSKTSSNTTQTDGTASLSTAAELLVGTIKLEDTDLAVTSDQARQLIPLWQMLQSLSTSSTAATEEIQAVVDQIKSTMTSDQMDEITAMKLTQQDMMTIMGQGRTSASGTPDATRMALNGLPSGDIPSGGGVPPSGNFQSGGSVPSGDFPSAGGETGMAGGPPNMSTTPQAVRSNGMADQIPAPLLNALIELLQKKVQP